jgi:hypothetical protein
MILIHGHHSEEMKAESASIGGLFRDMCELAFARYDLWPNAFGVPGFLFYLPQAFLLIMAFVLARRELLAQGKATARRFLTAFILVIPLVQILVTSLVRQVQGPSRYLAAYSIPLAICLALAWNAAASLGPRRRRLFRSALGLMLVVQAAAAMLDRGDFQREAIEWIAARHSGCEKILASSATVNCFAFGYLGFPHPELLTGLPLHKGDSSKSAAKRFIKELFAHERRGFILLYHDRGKILRDLTRPKRRDKGAFVLADLEKEGFILADRQWRLGQSTAVVAFIRDASERAWLKALPDPPKYWGPAAGVLKPQERRRFRSEQRRPSGASGPPANPPSR